MESWQPCTSALQVTDLKCHSLQQGFPCLTETFPVVVSCAQPDQRSGNSQLVSDARPATSPCQSSSHNSLHWKASSFPLAASSIHIPPRVSDDKYYKITQIQMAWVGAASCSSTCELPLLSCHLAFTESISSVSYGLTAFLYKPSITHSSSVIFNYYCRYIRQSESKLGAENQRVFFFVIENEKYFSNSDLSSAESIPVFTCEKRPLQGVSWFLLIAFCRRHISKRSKGSLIFLVLTTARS